MSIKSRERGFTLIELLVVISIIGLLSSIVLASVSSARDQAVNTAIKQNLNSIRAQAEIYFHENQTYAGLFSQGGQALILFNAAMSASGEGLGMFWHTGILGHQNERWYAKVKLRRTHLYWCVDNTGFAGEAPASGSDDHPIFVICG